MASIKLTKEVKRQIVDNLKKYVEESYFKSEIGKELLEAATTLISSAKVAAQKVCSKSDIKVLSKYGLVSKVDSLGVRKEYNKDEYYALINPSFSNKMFRKLDDENILYPYSCGGRLTTALNAELTNDFLQYVLMLHDKFTCEVDSIVAGYTKLLDSYTTIGKLLADHPQIEKHIPIVVFKKFAPPEPVVPQVVKLFETMEAQEERELEMAEA